jgi:hypothetical protein
VSYRDSRDHDEARAYEWERLAAHAKAIAERCEGAAFTERKSPSASGTFREIEAGLRRQIGELRAAFEALVSVRKIRRP